MLEKFIVAGIVQDLRDAQVLVEEEVRMIEKRNNGRKCARSEGCTSVGGRGGRNIGGGDSGNNSTRSEGPQELVEGR